MFLDKLEDVCPYFSLDDEGALSLELEYSKLQSDYGFTEEEIEKLDSAILEQNLGISYVNQDETTVQPQVYVEDWKIYFTTDEVRMYLGSAIQAGAPAVIASIASRKYSTWYWNCYWSCSRSLGWKRNSLPRYSSIS